MYHELRELGIFDRQVDLEIELAKTAFTVSSQLVSRMVRVEHQGTVIAMLSPAGLDVKEGYQRDVVDAVLDEVRAQLLNLGKNHVSSVSLALPRYVVSKQHSELSDQLSPEAMMWVLAKRGIFEAKLPDILVGQLLARVDHSDKTDVIFRLGQLEQHELGGPIEARWFMNYHQNGKYEIYPGSMERVSFNQTLKDALHRYNDIINGLMVNADNGLLV
jgi:hypothetical protein